jgi:hydrogenase maturation factor
MNANTTKVKFDLVRDSNNKIVRYIAIHKGLVIGNIDKVDAIGIGTVYTYRGFVFTKLVWAKSFAQASA